MAATQGPLPSSCQRGHTQRPDSFSPSICTRLPAEAASSRLTNLPRSVQSDNRPLSRRAPIEAAGPSGQWLDEVGVRQAQHSLAGICPQLSRGRDSGPHCPASKASGRARVTRRGPGPAAPHFRQNWGGRHTWSPDGALSAPPPPQPRPSRPRPSSAPPLPAPSLTPKQLRLRRPTSRSLRTLRAGAGRALVAAFLPALPQRGRREKAPDPAPHSVPCPGALTTELPLTDRTPSAPCPGALVAKPSPDRASPALGP